jgi:hypothetical protein
VIHARISRDNGALGWALWVGWNLIRNNAQLENLLQHGSENFETSGGTMATRPADTAEENRLTTASIANWGTNLVELWRGAIEREFM